MNTPAYIYRAEIERVIDGDTLVVSVDLGFHVWRRGERLRLLGVRAPEMRGADRPLGIQARAMLAALLPVGAKIIVETSRDMTDKYGRMLAVIWKDGVSINARMTAEAPVGGK